MQPCCAALKATAELVNTDSLFVKSFNYERLIVRCPQPGMWVFKMYKYMVNTLIYLSVLKHNHQAWLHTLCSA